LFPSPSRPGQPLTIKTAQIVFYRAAKQAQLPQYDGINASFKDAGFPLSLQDDFIFSTSTRHVVPG
jgi:hypothetical protein